MAEEILNNNFEKSYIANLLDKLSSFESEDEKLLFVLHEIVQNKGTTVSELRDKGYKAKIIDLLNMIDKKDLSNEEYIDKIINSKNKLAIKIVMASTNNIDCYNKLKDAYNSEITDGVVTLKRNDELSENPDITLSQSESFDIISNNEVVGVINYRYRGMDTIDYSGNLGYRIDQKYRGNGYAKRAVNLLIDILKHNTKYDEPLYVASTHDNKNFLKVALECGGKLVHTGKVPINVVSSYYDREMKEVDVYKIDIEKEKNYDRYKIN